MSATLTEPSAPLRARLPGGPRTPSAVNGALFAFGQARLSRELASRYGDAWSLELPTMGRVVFVAHPDLVKTVFTAKPDVLHAGENPLGRELGPGSLFSMDEERHLKERRLLLQPFHGDRMRTYEALIAEEALRAFADWPEDEPFATLPTFNTITLRVILRAVFGAEGDELAALERVLPPLTHLGQRMIAFPPLKRDLGRWSPGRRFTDLRDAYERTVAALIQAHLDDPHLAERTDILALLIRATIEGGEPLHRQDLADELLTLLLAGHETTASSLAWTVERLRRHPDVLARLQDEVAEGGSTLRAATINEVHRVRPVINGTLRVVRRPFDLGPYHLPPGTRIITAGTVLHDDDRWHEPAAAFDPQRYVGTKPDTYAWIPFGGGVRRCIGAAFAQMEMDVVLRTLLERFELVPTADADEAPRFRGIATVPARGGVAVVRRASAG